MGKKDPFFNRLFIGTKTSVLDINPSFKIELLTVLPSILHHTIDEKEVYSNSNEFVYDIFKIIIIG